MSSFPKLLLPREGAAGEADRGEHAVDKSIEKVRFACHVPIQSHRSNAQGSRDRSDADSFKSLLVDNPRDIAAVMDIAANARRRDGTLTFAPDGNDPVLAHLEQILRGGQDDGTLVEFNPRSLAILIRGAIDTAAGRLVKDPDFDFAAYRDQLVAIAESITARKEA